MHALYCDGYSYHVKYLSGSARCFKYFDRDGNYIWCFSMNIFKDYLPYKTLYLNTKDEKPFCWNIEALFVKEGGEFMNLRTAKYFNEKSKKMIEEGDLLYCQEADYESKEKIKMHE